MFNYRHFFLTCPLFLLGFIWRESWKEHTVQEVPVKCHGHLGDLSGVAGCDLLKRKWTTCHHPSCWNAGMCSSSGGEGPWGSLQTSTLVWEPCICCREMKLTVHGPARNFSGTQKYKTTGNQLLILARKLTSPPWCHKWGPKVPTGKTQLILSACYINVHLHETIKDLLWLWMIHERSNPE